MADRAASEAEAREVLAEKLDERGFSSAARGVRNGSVETMLLACLDAMLAFRPTPTTTGADEVERLREAAAKVADAEADRATEAMEAVAFGSPAHKAEVQRRGAARVISADIRALPLRAADAVRREVGA